MNCDSDITLVVRTSVVSPQMPIRIGNHVHPLRADGTGRQGIPTLIQLKLVYVYGDYLGFARMSRRTLELHAIQQIPA